MALDNITSKRSFIQNQDDIYYLDTKIVAIILKGRGDKKIMERIQLKLAKRKMKIEVLSNEILNDDLNSKMKIIFDMEKLLTRAEIAVHVNKLINLVFEFNIHFDQFLKQEMIDLESETIQERSRRRTIGYEKIGKKLSNCK